MPTSSFNTTFKLGDSEVVIDVDQTSAYAYFLTDGQVTGDVWLFNRGQAPKDDPWSNSTAEGPFPNSERFAIQFGEADDVEGSDFRVVMDDKKVAVVYFRGLLLATVWDGARPGKSRCAKGHSPVAQPLSPPWENISRPRFPYGKEYDAGELQVDHAGNPVLIDTSPDVHYPVTIYLTATRQQLTFESADHAAANIGFLHELEAYGPVAVDSRETPVEIGTKLFAVLRTRTSNVPNLPAGCRDYQRMN